MTITTTNLNQDNKTRALANYLQIKYSEAQELIDSEDWAVYTEEEALEIAGEYIENTLWAFNRSFLAGFSKVAAKIDDNTWGLLQSTLGENFNDVVLAMITSETDIDTFIEAAIMEDGIGHFLNTYDGEAIESDDVCNCKLNQNYILTRMN